MAMLVLAGNFLLLYVFWEAVGLCSYLLIGFWYTRASAAQAGTKRALPPPQKRAAKEARSDPTIIYDAMTEICRRLETDPALQAACPELARHARSGYLRSRFVHPEHPERAPSRKFSPSPGRTGTRRRMGSPPIQRGQLPGYAISEVSPPAAVTGQPEAVALTLRPQLRPRYIETQRRRLLVPIDAFYDAALALPQFT
jgi:hypothetical protein